MVLNNCRFCDHSNPEEAKFCSECGGCLHLLPCPSCGAVTDVSASTCYQCHAQLPVRATDAVVAAPAVQAANPASRWRTPVIAGSAVLAVLTALGYYGYRQRAPVNGVPPPGAGVQAGGRTGMVQPAVPASLKTDVSPAGAKPAAANPSNAALNLQESAPAKVIAAPAAAAEPPPATCPEAIAALGLCSATTPPVTHTGKRE